MHAVMSEDTLTFFHLYENAPMYSTRFLEYLVTQMRDVAYSHFIRTYLQLPLLHVQVQKVFHPHF